MNAIYLHSTDGFTFLENVPEKPKFIDDMYHVENCINDANFKAYERALAEAIEKRMVIGNPEVIEQVQFHIYHKEGELYPWPGTYKKEFEPQPNHATAYGIDIIRLIAPEPVNSSMSEKEESENNVIFYGDNPVTRVLVTCDGRINQNDGRCNKCLQVAQTTSSHCGRLVEKLSEPVVSQDQTLLKLLALKRFTEDRIENLIYWDEDKKQWYEDGKTS